MDRKQWMTTVLAAANAVYEACPEVRTDLEGAAGRIADEIQRAVQPVLSRTEDLYGFIANSEAPEATREVWADARTFDEVLMRVAFACLEHDVRLCFERILSGHIPPASAIISGEAPPPGS